MKENPLTYLTSHNLKTDWKLFNNLPIEIALRYHLLPIAKEGEYITIAMANPGDQEARQVVSQAFGDLTFIIQADLENIDSTLALADPNNPIYQHDTHLLVWQSTEHQNELFLYAQEIAKLLHGDIFLPAQLPDHNTLDILIDEIKSAAIDLLVVASSTLPIAETKLIDMIPVSTLITRTPCWPLKQILLILGDESNDDFTLDWALQLAYASQASLTVLPVLAPTPQMYGTTSRMRHSLSGLLTSNCPLGKRLREVSQQMVALKIDGVLHLRHETPQRQISAEIADGHYDLVILAAAQQNLYRRWLIADLVSPLLTWIDRPVLVAKSRLHPSVI